MIVSPIKRPIRHPFSRLDRQLSIFAERPALARNFGCPVCNIIRPFRPCFFICIHRSRRHFYARLFFIHELTGCKKICIPLFVCFKHRRCVSLHGYACQSLAGLKCRTPYTCHAARNRYFCQTFATRKRTLPYALHTVRNIDIFQVFASPKHLIYDAFDTERNANRAQISASVKQ